MKFHRCCSRPGRNRRPDLGAGVRAQGLQAAAPETVGMSAQRLGQISAVLKREIEQGNLPGAVVMVARKGRLVYSDAIGFQDSQGAQADAEGRDLPPLLDDQAAGVGGGDDAGGRGQDPADRSGLEVPARDEADAGERRPHRSGSRQGHVHAGVGGARDDGPGPAPALGGPGLRPDHAEHAGARGLYQGAPVRPRRRLRSARSVPLRVRRRRRAQPAGAPARHGLGVQHRDATCWGAWWKRPPGNGSRSS